MTDTLNTGRPTLTTAVYKIEGITNQTPLNCLLASRSGIFTPSHEAPLSPATQHVSETPIPHADLRTTCKTTNISALAPAPRLLAAVAGFLSFVFVDDDILICSVS